MFKEYSPYLFLLVILVVSYVFPWKNINWGKFTYEQPRYITVTGYAESEEDNQVATFSAGVSAANQNKETAVKEVDDKITNLITKVKDSGIEERDIKTQSISIYQDEVWNEVTRISTKGQWRVSNTVEVKLRDVERASDLTELLSNAGADNVWGPNFMVDNQSSMGDDLLDPAIKNARAKADDVAKSMNLEIVKVISVNEGQGSMNYGVYPMMREASMGSGGGGGALPGTSTVTKMVTVVYEVK